MFIVGYLWLVDVGTAQVGPWIEQVLCNRRADLERYVFTILVHLIDRADTGRKPGQVPFWLFPDRNCVWRVG